MNPIPEQFGNLLTVFETMKTDPRVDKKWLNKINARTEELQVLSTKLFKPEAIADQQNLDSTAPELRPDSCTCIYDPENQTKIVAIDAKCPIHKTH